MGEGQRAGEPSQEKLSEWIASNAVATLTVLGACLYLVVRLGLDTFYSAFGLAPDDVGIGYAEALSRAAGTTVFIFLLFGMVLGYMYILGMRPRGARRPGKLTVLLLLGPLFLALGLIVYLGATDAATKAKKGEAVELGFWVDFGVSAEPARIVWVDQPPARLRELSGHRLMYLGQSGGTAFLYDVDDGSTVQLPSNSVAISLIGLTE